MNQTNPEPIKGYTPLSDKQRALGNAFKEIEEALLRLVDLARETDLDGRWVSIAATHFNEGFMALNRANFKPERIGGEVDAGIAVSTAQALLKDRMEPKVGYGKTVPVWPPEVRLWAGSQNAIPLDLKTTIISSSKTGEVSK